MGSFSSADLEYMFWAGIRNGSIGTIGTKGDPGGLVLGTHLALADLNTITTPGLYYQNTSGEGTLVRNYPREGQSGALLVTTWGSSSAGAMQIFYSGGNSGLVNNGRIMWMRVLVGGVWQPWRGFSSTRVDTTAGRAIYQWDDVNNREQLIYGDTGWRDIKLDIVAPATVTNMMIRRVNQTVFLTVSSLDIGATGTVNNFYAIPAGFNPTTFPGGSATRVGLYSTQNGDSTRVVSPFQGNARILSSVSGQLLEGTVSWLTNEAWPTVLPGSASGTIPNL